MVADYFTKPLQGSLFRKFRDLIMNIDPDKYQDQGSVLEPEKVNADESVPVERESRTEGEWQPVSSRGARRTDRKAHF